MLEWLYADQAPADHLNQAATTARSTRMEYERLLRLSKAGLLNPQNQQQSIQPSENTRETAIQDNTHKSVRYTSFNGIEDNDTDSETTVRNHQEGSVPFQQPDDRDILDMSNNESDNARVRMVRYMLDQNIQTTMEKSPLAKAGVKVTPLDKYNGEQSFEALETFIKGLLGWLDMHSMLGPDAYRYQVSFLGTRLEGKALEWFDKQSNPGSTKYIPSLARREASNKFDFIKQGTLSVQEFTTELELYFVDNLRPGLRSLLLHAGYDPENKTIHKLYLTKHRADPTKSGEINKGPAITPGSSGVNRNSSNTPGGAGPPIINRQRTNHDSSHNSIECYNCGKSGHIKTNCPEPLRAHCEGAIHIEDSPTEQVDNTDQDINDPIDDECPTEDEYRNEDYDNQLDLSEDQHSWGSKPSEFDWSDDDQPHRVNSVRYSHDMARVTAAVPIGPANARKAKIAKEGEPLYDHTVKMKTTRPTWSKNNLLMITGYFLVGGTKARCLFDSGCEGIIMSSEFARATGICMHKLPEPIGIQQAFQGSRAKLYYTATTDITVGQRTYQEMFDIANIDYYDIMLGTPFLRRVKANIDFNGLGSIVINGETIDNDLSVWLTSNEAKIHGMSANKATRQGEQPLEPIVDQLSNNTKESTFETIKNELLVVPVPHTVKELQKLISMVAYMLPYCGCIKRPLDMLQHIYRDKPYLCNEDVYNVILDINSALSTTNVINYYNDIVIHDGYNTQHKDNVYSTKATVSASDYKKSLNGQNHSGTSIEEVDEGSDLPNIIVNNNITEDRNVLVDKTTPSHSFRN
ncbi:hypothetical protein M422DRAFT_264247 [Sphaerobolus stellatus SS14]|uniref:CCHC-type domain-containing protein n=1 Tax=Sphaerobolus stellatus (strain SS14) TaxID=990650 RepID=A0A0C9V8L5_SPHS4|nr:hypothetical protein M422DRAFT_264247 [Sphaerobolus stellatus SS14]